MTAPSVMRIDAHQYFWRYAVAEHGWMDDSMAGLRRDFLPADAQHEMARAGFDACVAVQTRQTLDETRWLLALAGAHPLIAGVVGWVDLQAQDARRQLELFADHRKLVGIRHIVQSEPDDRFMLRPEFCRGLALLEEFGWPAISSRRRSSSSKSRAPLRSDVASSCSTNPRAALDTPTSGRCSI